MRDENRAGPSIGQRWFTFIYKIFVILQSQNICERLQIFSNRQSLVLSLLDIFLLISFSQRIRNGASRRTVD